MGCGGTGLRGGVAEPAEMGRLASLKSVGPNARLVGDDLEGAIGELKAGVPVKSKWLARTWRKASPNLA